jgi:hypothetical protein
MTKSYRQSYNLGNGAEIKLTIERLWCVYRNAVVCSLTIKSPRNAGLKAYWPANALGSPGSKKDSSRTRVLLEPKHPSAYIGGVLVKEQTVTPVVNRREICRH